MSFRTATEREWAVNVGGEMSNGRARLLPSRNGRRNVKVTDTNRECTASVWVAGCNLMHHIGWAYT